MQSILDCAASDRDALLIADGGIKNSGDIVKALGGGADLVMCGSLISGTDESPGDVIRPTGGIPKKVYRGMASREAQKSWRGEVGSVEGVSTTVPVKGPVLAVLRDLEWGIRSGLSYSGCSSLKDFCARADFVIQTQSSMKESSTHILSII
jgi:IMP dehydrogenase